MDEKDILSHLKNIHRQSPDPAWRSRFRRELLAHMRADGGKFQIPNPKFQTLWNVLSGRMALAGGIALFVLMTGVGSVFATESLLPSSPFYRLKLAVESAKGTLAVTVEQKAAYGAAVAQRRVDELTRLSHAPAQSSKSSNQAILIAQTIQRYSDAISVSSRGLKQLKAEGKVAVAKQTAVQLEEAARAYTVLLSALDSVTSVQEFSASTSSSAQVLEHAKTLSDEAQATAGEILQDGAAVPSASSVSSIFPSASQTPAPTSSTTLSVSVSTSSATTHGEDDSTTSTPPASSVTPSASAHPAPTPMPNVVE